MHTGHEYVGPLGLLRKKPVLYDVKFISATLKAEVEEISAELWYHVEKTVNDEVTHIEEPVYDIDSAEEVCADSVSADDGKLCFEHSARVCLGPFTPSSFLVKVIQESSSREGMCSCAAQSCAAVPIHIVEVDLEDLADKGERSLTLDTDMGEIVLSVTSVDPAVAFSRGFALLLGRAWDLPDLDWFSNLTDPRCSVVVRDKDDEVLYRETSRCILENLDPIWDQVFVIPKADTWDIETTKIEVQIEDVDYLKSDAIGKVTFPLKQLVEQPNMRTLMYRSDESARVSSDPPHRPSQICFSLFEDTKPKAWPKSVPKKPWTAETYPRHIFMMTRGTRGDVQPFVALARGMAEMYGWLITICTEMRWRDFVKEKSKVSRGRIRFRPSGGDTEAKMGERISQWALGQKSEIMQMIILANSEANFFDSSTVFLNYIEEMSGESGIVEGGEPRPVDMIIAGLTVTAVGAAIAEYLKIPVAGYILQPTCIPSKDKNWKAVQAIDSHMIGWFDWFENKFFTSHKSLATLKNLSEKNPFQMYNISNIRDWLKLDRQPDTWAFLKERRMPFVIPIRPGTFDRPEDWWDEIVMTDFIFLRDPPKPGASTNDSLGEPLDTFLRNAKAAKAPVGLMSFSSMPVARKTMLKCATNMLEGSEFNMRLIYVGKKQPDNPGKELAAKAKSFEDEGRFIELERADFGKLFKSMEFFIIQGGLGTSVEALRCKKPIAVSGPLLLDQRWWGQVICDKGVGPHPEEINIFRKPEHCVKFVNDALDPADPAGYQQKAKAGEWGTESEDGVAINVNTFKKMLEDEEGQIWEE